MSIILRAVMCGEIDRASKALEIKISVRLSNGPTQRFWGHGFTLFMVIFGLPYLKACISEHIQYETREQFTSKYYPARVKSTNSSWAQLSLNI